MILYVLIKQKNLFDIHSQIWFRLFESHRFRQKSRQQPVFPAAGSSFSVWNKAQTLEHCVIQSQLWGEPSFPVPRRGEGDWGYFRPLDGWIWRSWWGLRAGQILFRLKIAHLEAISQSRWAVLFWGDLDKRVIQQEVDDADIEDAIVIIPTFANVITHNDLREGITGQRERLVLGDCLFLRSQSVGGTKCFCVITAAVESNDISNLCYSLISVFLRSNVLLSSRYYGKNI